MSQGRWMNEDLGTPLVGSGTWYQEPGIVDNEPGTLVRAPNHLGDFILSLPALAAVPHADILIAPSLTALARLIRPHNQVIPLQSGIGGVLRTAATLRHRRYRRAVLLPRSLSSAVLVSLAGIPERRGTATDGRGALLTEPVSSVAMDARHRSAEYLELVTGSAPGVPPVPTLPVPASAHSAWRQLVGDATPQIAVFPGSNAASRRWDPERFGRLVERLVKAGWSVAVLGGPDARALTATVAGSAARDLGGQTDLPTLTAGVAACRLLVTNDSGPMHLAAAVGTPTVSLWGAGDPGRTGPLGEHHTLLRHHALPCISCQKNRCPRRGAGYHLPEARNECLALISEEEVWEAVHVAVEWKNGRVEKWKSDKLPEKTP